MDVVKVVEMTGTGRREAAVHLETAALLIILANVLVIDRAKSFPKLSFMPIDTIFETICSNSPINDLPNDGCLVFDEAGSI